MKLISGSFRGFPFSILDHSIDGENFTSNHDFINSRFNLVENYGPQAKKFSLTVIVKGETIEDYHEARDGFIAVLDQPGTGELIHPFLGKLKVAVLSYSHGSRDGVGLSQFNISFIEQKIDVAGEIDFKYEFGEQLRSFQTQTVVQVNNKISVKKLIREYYKKVEDNITSAMSSINTLKNTLDYSEYIEKINSITDLATGKKHWDNIFDFFSSYFTFKDHTLQVVSLYQELLNYDRVYPTGKELTQERLYLENLNLTNETIKYVAIAKLAQLVLDEELNTNQKLNLIKKIKISRDNPIIPGTYDILNSIENYIFETIEETELVTIDVPVETPALVIAHEHNIPLERILPVGYNINRIRGVYRV